MVDQQPANRAQLKPGAQAGSARPPGPEEPRGATATGPGASGKGAPPARGDRLRSPRFWITLVVLAAVNWFLVGVLLPEPSDRLTVSWSTSPP